MLSMHERLFVWAAASWLWGTAAHLEWRPSKAVCIINMEAKRGSVHHLHGGQARQCASFTWRRSEAVCVT
eukprot:407670-Pelagomonas_calceolata.AAC.6